MINVPTNIEKIRESQYLRFIDTTPSGANRTWVAIGIGVEEGNAGAEYNPNIERVKWIIEDNARSDHKSNDKQISVPQKTYKNDPCFEFVNNGRDVLNYKTNILEIDTWNVVNSAYKAKMSSGTIAITSYNGDEINWDLYFDGNPTDGTATISSGTPAFTESACL